MRIYGHKRKFEKNVKFFIQVKYSWKNFKHKKLQVKFFRPSKNVPLRKILKINGYYWMTYTNI